MNDHSRLDGISDRAELIRSFYASYDEETRLERTRHGQLEYLTTMRYIHEHLPAGGRVLELGAGTGRYSVALAREGYPVTAVELSGSNLEILRRRGAGIANLSALQGDALDLGRFPDESFDMTLLLGPMYHLYEERDRRAALREALRVTKKGGVLISAFLSVHAIIYNNYLRGNTPPGLEMNFDKDWNTRHFLEQLFTGYDVDELEALFDGLPVERIALASADGALELAEDRADFALSDEDFAAFARYHLRFCEKRELLGLSSHLLYVCRRTGEA